MWLFLPFGFFSVVAHDKHSGLLVVRARAQRDAEDCLAYVRRVAERESEPLCLGGGRCLGAERHLAASDHVSACPAHVPARVTVTPKHDYAYRFFVSRELWGLALETFANEDLTYPNFKAEVYRAQGIEREGVYMRVWALMRRALGPSHEGVEENGEPQ